MKKKDLKFKRFKQTSLLDEIIAFLNFRWRNKRRKPRVVTSSPITNRKRHESKVIALYIVSGNDTVPLLFQFGFIHGGSFMNLRKKSLLPPGRTAPPPFSKDFCDIVVSGCRIRLRNVMNREAVVTTWRRNTLIILDAGTNSGGFSFGPLGGTEEERGRGVNGINVVRASSTNHSPSDLQTSSSRGIKHPLLVRTIQETSYHLGNETRASRSPCAVPRSNIIAESYYHPRI